MTKQFQVVVMLNEGLADPQGKAIEDALPTLGFEGVSEVRVGKVIHLTMEGPTDEEIRRRVHEISERVLSNPVIESFWIVDVEEGSDVEVAAP
ncbi:MAG TPA: phosphoribosylformylglycinamidine synthase subunit PurS [Actinomycetota bacterium]|nr:phosphoribosylformylglycinamidine synthase subunit PurS [Actinomycetota bacterium]